MEHETKNDTHRISRRAFVHRGALWMSGAALAGPARVLALTRQDAPAVRLGLITDVHYADKQTAGTRHYRESLTKIREAVAKFNDTPVDAAVELGDFVDAAEEVETEIGYLKAVEREFAKYQGPRHYVLGNHCVWSLTKEQFLAETTGKKSYYSFDQGGFHFIILDACFRADGVAYGNKNYEWTDTEIPHEERQWLTADLAATDKRTIAFVHQRLDVSNHYGVKSAPAVRKVLEASGKVLAVFQGHNHVNEHQEIGGIHYCTLAAMVEGSGATNNAYSMLDVYENGTLRLQGFRKHVNRAFGSAAGATACHADAQHQGSGDSLLGRVHSYRRGKAENGTADAIQLLIASLT